MQKIMPAVCMLLVACCLSCSNATPASDNTDAATPNAAPATGTAATPPVQEDPHPGETKRDHVEVKKTDTAAGPIGNIRPRVDSLQQGSIRR